MKLKLNGWQRLGMVASITWGIVGYMHQRNTDFHREVAAQSVVYQACSDTAAMRGNFDFSGCAADASRLDSALSTDALGNALVFAFGPIVLGWVVTYLAIFVFGWVRRGFSAANT
jgi:hypothetical protein